MAVLLKRVKKPTLIFDFDGTIADTFTAVLPIMTRELQKFNRRHRVYTLAQFRLMSYGEIIKYIPGAWWRGPSLIAKTKAVLFRDMSKVAPVEGMPYVLRALAAENYDLIIVTSNSIKNVKNFLHVYEMDDIFATIVSTKSLFDKAARLLRTIKTLQLDKKDCVYLGDEIRDVAACREIGLKIIALTSGFNSREGLERWSPNFIATKPRQILEIVQGWK